MAGIQKPKSGARSPREAAVHIVTVLQQAGHVAYLAGGCVRDELLGYHPKDYDVATDARPEKVRALFKRSRYVGESFGVVQVHIHGGPASTGDTVEVATFRAEWGYEDGRRPSKVHYTDARCDAQRRDFTINALFENPLAGGEDEQIIDFVGGLADLQARVVRAVGDPESRLSEDYLRLLRAVRFATRLNFEIEPRTADAIRGHARDLGRISRQRIGQEAMWMLTPGLPPGSDAMSGVDLRSAEAIKWIQQLHLDGPMLEEDLADVPLLTVIGLVKGQPALATAGEKTLGGPGYATILAAWLLDRHLFPKAACASVLQAGDHSGSEHGLERFVVVVKQFIHDQLSPIINRWRRALCLSNPHRDGLRQVLELLPVALAWSGLRIAKKKRLLAHALWPQLYGLLVAMSDRSGVSVCVDAIGDQSPHLVDQGVAPTPWVGGDDLIAMGRKPGPEFRRLLEAVYDAQLEGTVNSRDEALAWLEQHR